MSISIDNYNHNRMGRCQGVKVSIVTITIAVMTVMVIVLEVIFTMDILIIEIAIEVMKLESN